ncbi:hypothetical protein A3C18_00030 [Candidatus Kaiserbacteria bacterium RIFCSPHIGHO2_02_FULL_54_11b]|uniref:Uncharacterized protein n=1 Tax=Candidatus Kaiserbacteria bacterium RIFCSPHIGHO2_02_FULL_54_11b TaxID=1798494 RepID=A0A1F6DS30_9BACT|nr:MAG: hypothetical protein A3C18_00030 [Candidatus Kaiserbacteria bacterium RIFCSPHIGHO2_02_FULL_54_11b]
MLTGPKRIGIAMFASTTLPSAAIFCCNSSDWRRQLPYLELSESRVLVACAAAKKGVNASADMIKAAVTRDIFSSYS